MKIIPLIARFCVIVILLGACGDTAPKSETADSQAGNSPSPKEMVANPSGRSLEDRLAEIDSLEVQVGSEGDQPTEITARKLMGAYLDFAIYQSKDDRVPEFLFRAGEWARYIGRKKKAVEVFQQVYDNYPDYDRRIEALNWVAFICDFETGQKEEARAAYQKLANQHADHPLGKDAQARLQTIDLSDEELIKKFREQNKPS
jgi:tetratricopeptide (TPR) repeat protein